MKQWFSFYLPKYGDLYATLDAAKVLWPCLFYCHYKNIMMFNLTKLCVLFHVLGIFFGLIYKGNGKHFCVFSLSYVETPLEVITDVIELCASGKNRTIIVLNYK